MEITLRKLGTHDLKHFYTWTSDEEVAKTTTWSAYKKLEEAQSFLEKVVENHPWFMAICLQGIPIGSITLLPGQGHFSHKAELGYVLARSYWGQGITTTAVKLAISKGFKDLNVLRIEAFVDPNHLASNKVLLKAGLAHEGLLKKHLLFKGIPSDRNIYSITI